MIDVVAEVVEPTRKRGPAPERRAEDEAAQRPLVKYLRQPAAEESRPAYEALREDTFPRVRELADLLPDRDVEEELAMGVDALLEGLDRRRSAAR